VKRYTGIVLTVLLSLTMTAVQGVTAKQKEKVFSGVIIYFSDECVELKKGKTELTVYRDTQTIVENKTGDEGQSALSLCQKARAYYIIEGGRPRLVKLQILSPGYCGS